MWGRRVGEGGEGGGARGATPKGGSILEGLGVGSPEKCDPRNFEIDIHGNVSYGNVNHVNFIV